MDERFATPCTPRSDDDNPQNVIEDTLSHQVDDPRLQRGLSTLKKNLHHLADVMAQSKLINDPNTKLYSLHNEVQELSRFRHPETRTVGLIGNTGVGKSSVINSILGTSSLARSNDDGHACTCVVVEYRAVDDQHTRPYTIETEFMNMNEMRDLLWQLLSSVRLCYYKVDRVVNSPGGHGKGNETDNGFDCIDTDTEDENDPGDEVEELDEQEILQYQKSNITALQTFNALFKGQDKLTHEFLVRDDGPEAEDEILKFLVDKAAKVLSQRMEWPNTTQDINISESLDECRDKLDLLTTNPKTDQPAIWPFIKLIRCGLPRSSHLEDWSSLGRYARYVLICGSFKAFTESGKGLHDLNYTRQKDTESYIQRNCDVLGFVTKMSRCHADPTIEEIHWKCDPDLPQIVVVTCSELLTISDRIYKNVSTEESSRDDTEDNGHLRNLTNRIQGIKHGIRVKSQLKKKAQGQKRKDIAEEISDLRRRNLVITRRNEKVIAEMAQSKVRGKMRVFCVSNTLFNDYEGCDGELERAYVELSGIPALRFYCRSIPADAQMECTSFFLKSLVPATLNFVTLWCKLGFDQEKLLRAAGISEVLETLTKELYLMTSAISGRQNAFDWLMTGRRRDYSWDNELTRSARAKLTPLWDEVMKDLGCLSEKSVMDIIECIEKLSQPLRGQFTDN
ncbi:hypothetical protein F1880_007066 [Penicillium rolfsii]|nr:hypothetical protein F1880_007066 [Penicillium rolfsii]